MSSIPSTSGRLHTEFVFFLFLQDHWETDLFFPLSGFQLVKHDRGLVLTLTGHLSLQSHTLIHHTHKPLVYEPRLYLCSDARSHLKWCPHLSLRLPRPLSMSTCWQNMSVPETPIFKTSWVYILLTHYSFLDIPATSCPVERLLSVTGQTDTDRRASLSTDNLTLVVFMHETLPLLRKIRTDRIVQEVLGSCKCSFYSYARK